MNLSGGNCSIRTRSDSIIIMLHRKRLPGIGRPIATLFHWPNCKRWNRTPIRMMDETIFKVLDPKYEPNWELVRFERIDANDLFYSCRHTLIDQMIWTGIHRPATVQVHSCQSHQSHVVQICLLISPKDTTATGEWILLTRDANENAKFILFLQSFVGRRSSFSQQNKVTSIL